MWYVNTAASSKINWCAVKLARVRSAQQLAFTPYLLQLKLVTTVCEATIFANTDGNAGDNHSVASTQGSVASKDKVVTELFPESADFICLQEVFDSRAAKALLNGLNEK